MAKEAVSGILKIKTIEAMERFDEEGGSFRGSYDGGTSNRRSYAGNGSYRGSYEDGMSYTRSYDDGGNSMMRGRGADGRYVSRDGIREKLEHLMQEAQGNEKEVIREMLSRM